MSEPLRHGGGSCELVVDVLAALTDRGVALRAEVDAATEAKPANPFIPWQSPKSKSAAYLPDDTNLLVFSSTRPSKLSFPQPGTNRSSFSKKDAITARYGGDVDAGEATSVYEEVDPMYREPRVSISNLESALKLEA